MNKGINNVLYWLPRVLGIVITVFISLFALDVFGENYRWWEMVGAFLIHLVPTYILIGVLVLAWKKEQLGGLVFIGLGALYIVMVAGRAADLTWMIIPSPLIVIGILFIIQGRMSEPKKAND